MRPTVYLDLDRTLFRTNKSRQIWDEIASLYPKVDVSKAYETRSKYYVYVGDLYSYDMSPQLREFGLDPTEVYERLLMTPLSDGRFEYEGAGELVSSLEGRADVKILTFGVDDFQHFKIALCPSLRGIEVITTLRPKAEYFRKHTTDCWVVDDKAIGHELPSYVRFVHVGLDGQGFPSDASWPCFRSLKDVSNYFEEVLPRETVP